MTVDILPQVLVNAIVLSLIYVLMALGLSLVFSIMSMINFAHGEIYMLGAFAVYYFFDQWHLGYVWALIGSMVVGAIAGLFLERLIFRPLRGRPGFILASCLASLGVGYMLASAAQIVFGEKDKAVATPVSGVLKLGTVFFSYEKLLVVVTGLVLTIGLILVIRYSKLGHALQAIAQDRDAAALMGININRLNAIGFALASALAGAAGGLIAPIFFISPYMGDDVVLKAFIIVILGGLGSLPGAVLAGFILGFVESFGLTLIGYAANIIGFAIVIIFLIFRSRGLLGREFRVH
jgi:branched-chain amino acid transport system permease protein